MQMCHPHECASCVPDDHNDGQEKQSKKTNTKNTFQKLIPLVTCSYARTQPQLRNFVTY